MPLQQILKEATRGDHEKLEKLLHVDEIMNGSLSLPQYQQLLVTNYRVHAVWEDLLFDSLTPELSASLEADHRRKMAALTKDIQEAGLILPAGPLAVPPLVSDQNNASVLGALYVLEGATLGGNVIVKKLIENSNISKLTPGFHYYQVYGKDLVLYWKKFCEVLNAQPPDGYATAIENAKRMYAYIENVYEEVHSKWRNPHIA